MNLSFTPIYLEFQAEVQNFLAKHWSSVQEPPGSSDTNRILEFRASAISHGYLYRQYPRSLGGAEQPADVLKALIINEEFMRVGAPMEVGGIGTMMLAPVLLEVGSAWQKEHFIPRTLTGEYRWAQGYSEPSAGSDLASLKSRAELVGDEWLMNGHKIWTTRANEATHMFALLRTESSAAKHAGLSYILIDLRQPGVTIKPIHQINGGREFCEVFLDNVRTPADWIVGERGEGWSISRVNLKHERASIGSTGRSQPAFDSLLRLARSSSYQGRPAIQDPVIRGRIAMIEGFLEAQRWSGFYQLTLSSRGESAGVLSYTNKITTTNINQEIASIASEIIGAAGLCVNAEAGGRGPEKWNNQILGSLALAVAGGTSNIQRNIIAERGLGLPRGTVDN